MSGERPLTAEHRRWLTATLRYPVLATIRSDGMPSLSVIWAVLQHDDTLLMNTRRDREKARNVARDPRVSLCYEDGYQYLTLEGVVALRDDPDLADINRIRDAYRDDYDFSSQRGERVSMVMTVERVLQHLKRL
jgi:PPOX class probable F420-dependent enzyme